MTWLLSVISQSHRIKLTRHFVGCVADFGLFNFWDLLNKQEPLWDTEGREKTKKAHYISFNVHFMCAFSVLPHLWDGNWIRAWEILLKSYRVGWCPGVSSHLNSNDATGEESVCLSSHVPHHHWKLVTATHLWVQSGGSWWSQRDRWHIIVCSVFYDMILFVCNAYKS